MSKHSRLAVAAAALLIATMAGSVTANQIPGATITGHLTAVSGGDWINIDGKSYHIRSGSPAATAAPKLAVGAYLDVQLSGPANTSASEVINVVAHPADAP